ncbi:MAG: MlaD family protein, partial [Sphingomicrobium sp.]
ILENIEKTTDVLRERSPEMADTIAEMRIAAHNAGIAAQRVGVLSDSTNRLVIEQGRPAAEDLRKSIAAIQKAAESMDQMLNDARPGVQNFSKSTLPEVNRLVRDLQELSQSLKSVTDRVDQGGIGGALGPAKLPDYDPGKRQ